MQTIIIPVSKDNTEDDYLSLVEILAGRYPTHTVKITDALLVETDVPEVAALFASMIPVPNGKPASIPVKKDKAPADKKFDTGNCINCGKSIGKYSTYCKSCSASRPRAPRRSKAILPTPEHAILE